MIVAINTICLFDRDRNLFLAGDYWMKSLFTFIAQRPSDDFYIFLEKPNISLPEFPKLHYVIFENLPDSFLRARLWLWYKIKKELKKSGSELFIQIGGVPIITKIPQILVSPDSVYLFRNEELKNNERKYLKSRLPRFYNHLQKIVVGSEFEQSKIATAFSQAKEKIIIHRPTVAALDILSVDEKEEIKNKFSDGNEFFIYSGSVGLRTNLLNLLKAFSAFKKRQKSSMKLVIAGKESTDFEEFKNLLSTYKFKNDVKVYTALSESECNQLLSAAYAGIFPSGKELNTIEVLKMMQAGVPIVAADQSVVNELADDAALYFSPDDFKEMSERMMMIYKNENLKSQLSLDGLEKFKNFQNDNTLHFSWERIFK